MMRAIFTSSLTFLLSACVVPQTLEALQARNPPAEFGRPGYVRFMASTGAWIGGIGGGVVSIALLPVTWPISLLAKDGLGEMSSQEFLFFPAVGTASLGHFLFGTPVDGLDYLFRRAWISLEPLPNSYELVPMEASVGAAAAEQPPRSGDPDR